MHVYRCPWRLFKGYLDVVSSKRKCFQFPNFYMLSFRNWSAWKHLECRLQAGRPALWPISHHNPLASTLQKHVSALNLSLTPQHQVFPWERNPQGTRHGLNWKHCCNCWRHESNYYLVTHSLPFMWLPVLSFKHVEGRPKLVNSW